MKRILPVANFLLFAILFLVPAPAQAGPFRQASCGTSSCYQPTYYPQVQYIETVREYPVAYPVPFTVAVPVVSYLYNGGGFGYVPAYQAQLGTPMGTVNQMTQPQAQPQAQPKAQAPQGDAISALTDTQIDNLIARIEARLDARKAGAGNGGGVKGSPPPPVPQPDVLSILTAKRGNNQKSCADCHTGATAKKGFKIFTAPGVLNEAADWAAIWDQTDTGEMPPEAKNNINAALSDQEVLVLRTKMMALKTSRR